MKEFIVSFTDDADIERLEREHGTNGEIVRCKDCKYWNEEKAETNYDFGFGTAVCSLLRDIDAWGEYPESCFHRSEDFFCAYGERRDTDG